MMKIRELSPISGLRFSDSHAVESNDSRATSPIETRPATVILEALILSDVDWTRGLTNDERATII